MIRTLSAISVIVLHSLHVYAICSHTFQSLTACVDDVVAAIANPTFTRTSVSSKSLITIAPGYTCKTEHSHMRSAHYAHTRVRNIRFKHFTISDINIKYFASLP